jgi:TRAP-type transport system periplasmic protein
MKQMKPTLLKVGLFLIMFLFSVIPLYAQAKTNPVTLNFSVFYPAPHKMSGIATEWAKEVEKRTNGGVKITMFYGSTLAPADKAYEAVKNGIADIAWSALGYFRGRFPLTEIADMPVGAKDAFVANKAINAYYKKFKPKEFDDVKVLFLVSTSPQILHSAKPVSKLEDVKRMKIRSGGLTAKVAAALGGAPVAMPIGEAYDALSKGVAEATILPYEAMEGWRLGEVVKYHIESYGSACIAGQFVVMNKDKWNKLSADMQKAVDQVNEEWIEKTGRAWVEIEESGKNFVVKRGNTIVTLSKEEDNRWAKAVKPVLEEYAKVTKTKGLPGDQVLKFWQEYLSKNQ